MKTHEEFGKPVGLTPAQVQAATLLAAGLRGKDAAAELKVTEECISRWRRLPHFAAWLNHLVQDSVDATRLGLNDLGTRAIKQLGGLLNSESESTRLKAIELILEAQTAIATKHLETDPEAIALDQKNKQNMNSILAKLTG